MATLLEADCDGRTVNSAPAGSRLRPQGSWCNDRSRVCLANHLALAFKAEPHHEIHSSLHYHSRCHRSRGSIHSSTVSGSGARRTLPERNI
ncbi:hypothetical protein MTO96_006144 [Rhipicephalus appendiculatus]